MINYIILGLSCLTVVVYLITFFLLIELKRRTAGKLGATLTYLMVAVFVAIILRVEGCLSKIYIIEIPYSAEVLAIIFALFLMIAAITFLKNIEKFTDKKKR
jgi:F0F1-type ATP synthase assembly protein I